MLVRDGPGRYNSVDVSRGLRVGEDLRAQLEARQGRSYLIERELGGGGMSRVFLATERALGRRVVIKVLAGEHLAGPSARRFEREIQVAASLQQANIVPVLSAGDVDGMPFYTMPFVEGLSLRDRLVRDGRPSLGEAVSILRDVARALAYAHEHGFVHRDIKPENVLLSGDAAVVADFGIAKAVQRARLSTTAPSDTAASTTLTADGLSLGTPAYMAPEQIASDPAVDHRADLYSYGCLAYELLTGNAPFAGRPAHAQLAAHLGEVPVPVGELNPDTPSILARVVTRCLEKDPSRRPSSAREILTALEGATAATGVTRFHQSLSRRQRAIGFGAAAAVVLVASIVLGGGRASDAVSVAVIPFLNAGADSTEAYLADGLADGLATGLGKVKGLRVVSRSLSRRYKGVQALDPREVGRELSATQVLQGSVRRTQGRIQVSAQLTDANDNSEAWSETYDRAATDAHVVQEEITRAIVDALRERLGVDLAVPDKVGSGTSNADAYDLFLRGQFLLQRRGIGVRQAITNFERAIQLDSNFAAPRASLALALELLPYFEERDEAAVRPLAVAAANFALARDSTLADAHTALAMAHQHAYEWRAAETRYERAMALDPDEADAHIQYGRFLFSMGRVRPALARFERARTLAPYSAVASGWVGHLLDLSGRPHEGLAELTRALEIDSTSPPVLIFAAQAHLSLGNFEAGKRLMERLWRTVPQWRPPAAHMLSALGDTSRVRDLMRETGIAGEPIARPNLRSAILYLAIGDTAAVLDALERATAAGENWPMYYSLSERQFDVLRGNPRFAALVRSVGLDEATFTSPDGGRSR